MINSAKNGIIIIWLAKLRKDDTDYRTFAIQMIANSHLSWKSLKQLYSWKYLYFLIGLAEYLRVWLVLLTAINIQYEANLLLKHT